MIRRSLRFLWETVPKTWLWVLDETQHLLEDLSPEGGRRVFELWRQIPERITGHSGKRSTLEQLHYLLIRLSDLWPTFWSSTGIKTGPWTNNGTEQAIGRMQMRSRTVRSYKSWRGM